MRVDFLSVIHTSLLLVGRSQFLDLPKKSVQHKLVGHRVVPLEVPIGTLLAAVVSRIAELSGESLHNYLDGGILGGFPNARIHQR